MVARLVSSRLVRRSTLACVLAFQVTSCTLLLSSVDDLTGGVGPIDGGPDDAGDAAPRASDDADRTSDAADAVADAADAAIVRTWDFSLGCGEWFPVGETVVTQESEGALSPPAACRLCGRDAEQGQIALYLPSGFIADGKTLATLTAHVRSGVDGGALVPVRVSIYSPPVSNRAAYGSAGAAYAAVSAVGELVPETALYITGGTAAQGCIVVDDVSLTQ